MLALSFIGTGILGLGLLAPTYPGWQLSNAKVASMIIGGFLLWAGVLASAIIH